MDLETFKNELSKTGVPYEMLQDRFVPSFSGFATLEKLIVNSLSTGSIVRDVCKWGETPEGYHFWRAIADGRNKSGSPEVAAWKANNVQTAPHGLQGHTLVPNTSPEYPIEPGAICEGPNGGRCKILDIDYESVTVKDLLNDRICVADPEILKVLLPALWQLECTTFDDFKAVCDVLDYPVHPEVTNQNLIMTQILDGDTGQSIFCHMPYINPDILDYPEITLEQFWNAYGKPQETQAKPKKARSAEEIFRECNWDKIENVDAWSKYEGDWE